jgi:ATP phosphoribosyltransferase regulatory subunit HisZ
VYSFSALKRKNKLFRLLLSVKQQHIKSLIKDAKDFNDYLFNSPDYINTMQTLENKENASENMKDPITDEKQKNVEESVEDQKQENRIDSISLSKY